MQKVHQIHFNAAFAQMKVAVYHALLSFDEPAKIKDLIEYLALPNDPSSWGFLSIVLGSLVEDKMARRGKGRQGRYVPVTV